MMEGDRSIPEQFTNPITPTEYSQKNGSHPSLLRGVRDMHARRDRPHFRMYDPFRGPDNVNSDVIKRVNNLNNDAKRYEKRLREFEVKFCNC